MSGHAEGAAELISAGSVRATWIKWFALISGSCLLLLVFSLNKANGAAIVGIAMYVIIGVVAVACVYKSYLDVKYFENEMKLAADQVKILEHVNSFDEFFAQAKPSLFRFHISNLFTISKTHTEINQDNLIEILHGRLLARNQVVELFASVLITLGLIGTIVGLIFMMNGLTEVMQTSGGSSNLLVDLTKAGGPLSGLGVAFYTTLLGATLGGVLLRILTSVVDTSITQYTAHMAELTEVYVLPYLRKLAQSGQH